ncbi:MAG: signal recognition particle protein, partial [bacterium]|nr:signal recognition particle protein [bacterium]
LQQLKNMGPIENLLEFIPGMNKLPVKGLQMDEGALKRTEAIISSMTMYERTSPRIINGSRRLRIAKGSGTAVSEVNKLLKQFFQMQKMIKKMSRQSFGKKGMKGMQGMGFGF